MQNTKPRAQKSRLCNRKSQITNRKFYSGYTLVEMVVVMAIIAVLMTIGVSAFINSRRQAEVQDFAEQLKSDIRLAQVKAMSTEGSCPDDVVDNPVPKLWGIKIDAGAKMVYSYNYCHNDDLGGERGWRQDQKTIDAYGLELEDMKINNDDSINTIGLVFNAPLGKFYAVSDIKSTCIGEESPDNPCENPGPPVPEVAADNTVDGALQPTPSVVYSDIDIQLTYWGITFYVEVDPKTGTATVLAAASPPSSLPPLPSSPTCSLTSSSASANPGQTVTPSWTTTNSPTVAYLYKDINKDIDSVNPSGGSKDIMIQKVPIIYTMTVSNSGGSSLCQTTIREPDLTSPTVSITAPANDATVSGIVAISAAASDNVAVSKVEFYVDGIKKEEDATSPYQANWSTSAVINGAHTLKAKAIDTSGLSSENSISVNVSNPTSAIVNITSPAPDDVWVINYIWLKANATSSERILWLTVYLDGAWKWNLTGSSIDLSFQPIVLSTGPHTITIDAYSETFQVIGSATRRFNINY